MSANGKKQRLEIDAVLFDFGGVLAQEGFRRGLKEIARRNGLDPETFFARGSEAVYASGYVTGEGSEEDFWRLMQRESGLSEDLRDCSALILRRFVLRPAMLDAACRLKKSGKTVAILSDQTDWLDRLERRDRFFHLFDRVFNSYHLGKGKRDPSLFDDVVAELGVEPQQALFIDDNAGHVRRARDRGLHAILFRSPKECLARLSKKVGESLSALE